MVEVLLQLSPPLLKCSPYPPIRREVTGKTLVKCSLEIPLSLCCSRFISTNTCQLASASNNNGVTLPFDDGRNLMMMRGMTTKDFDPVRYSGRGFEVASLKRGFAGQGQEDCHCTQVKCCFIDKSKAYLANFGYDPSEIKDTPQDCQVMSNSQLAAMMSMSGMQQTLTNQFPDLQLKSPLELNPFTSLFDTLKKLLELYF